MVKCKVCKVEVVKTEAITKLFEGNKTQFYFCSNSHLDEYEKKVLDKVLKQDETNKFKELDLYIAVEILNYEKGQIISPYMKKRIKDLVKNYNHEVVKLTFQYVKKDLLYYMNSKSFNNDQHKTNYIMTVVNNNINEIYKRWKEVKQTKQQQERQIKVNTVNEDIMETIQSTPVKPSVRKDISAFLDEED